MRKETELNTPKDDLDNDPGGDHPEAVRENNTESYASKFADPTEEKGKENPETQPGGLNPRENDNAMGDIESGLNGRMHPKHKGSSVVITTPLAVLEPHRTDPMQGLRQRHKKLERAVASGLPELHFSGQLVCGQGIIQDSTEGCCCRFNF